jgi:hypothetical protein
MFEKCGVVTRVGDRWAVTERGLDIATGLNAIRPEIEEDAA